MRRGGIAQAVDRFHHGFQRGEVTDGVVGTGDIVIDGARQTDAREAFFRQAFGAHVGTVATDHHQRVDAAILQVFNRLGAHVFILNSGKRAEPRKVPPRLIMSDTL